VEIRFGYCIILRVHNTEHAAVERLRRVNSPAHPRSFKIPHSARYILRPSFLSLALVLVVPSVAFAQATSSELTANPIYQKQCAKCHGNTGEGRHFGGPSLVSGKSTTHSDDELRNMIIKGKGRMPKYGGKLTPEDIDTLVRQMKEARVK
jgi:cytochrome c5